MARLSDIVNISRAYIDPPQAPVYFNGKPAIVISISAADGLNSEQFGRLLKDKVTALQNHVHKVMSREIVREHGVMLLLGSMRAEERLAAFVLNLVQRLHARGFSKSELVLRMTREEIGSYLGLKLETVSRTFSKFADDNIIEVRQRHLRILDTDALKRIVNSQQCQ